MKTTRQVLIEAKALIADPKNWTQNWFAKDVQGKNTYFAGDNAVCYCSLGAVYKAEDGHTSTTAAWWLDKAVQAHKVDGLTMMTTFNDTRTHAEVMELFDKALEMATEAGDDD